MKISSGRTAASHASALLTVARSGKYNGHVGSGGESERERKVVRVSVREISERDIERYD